MANNTYPDKLEFAGVPKYFLSMVMPEIQDADELKTTLVFFKLYFQKKSGCRHVTDGELASSNGCGLSVSEIRSAMSKAAERGHILKLNTTEECTVYLLNDREGTETAGKIAHNRLIVQDVAIADPEEHTGGTVETSSIFMMYEENIGILTPIIAEELKTAIAMYPVSWIKDAISESVKMNKRSWRYIGKILDNWSVQGKSDGTYREDTKSHNKYTRGTYGKHVQR